MRHRSLTFWPGCRGGHVVCPEPAFVIMASRKHRTGHAAHVPRQSLELNGMGQQEGQFGQGLDAPIRELGDAGVVCPQVPPRAAADVGSA